MEEARSYTVKEAAAYIKMSPDYIRSRVRDGSLGCYRYGWCIRFSKEHLEEFMTRMEKRAKHE